MEQPNQSTQNQPSAEDPVIKKEEIVPPDEAVKEIQLAENKMAKLFIALGILFVIFVAVFFAYSLWKNQQNQTPQPTPIVEVSSSPTASPTACTMEAKLCPDGSYVGRTGPNCEFTACPPAPTFTPTFQSSTSAQQMNKNWQVYKNQTYGFQIFYPDSYKALDDKENLYGWPNAVVLLYKGGQAYDIVIEVWDSPEAYKTKYDNSSFDVTVKQVNGKTITILNSTNEPDAKEIIATFQAIK